MFEVECTRRDLGRSATPKCRSRGATLKPNGVRCSLRPEHSPYGSPKTWVRALLLFEDRNGQGKPSERIVTTWVLVVRTALLATRACRERVPEPSEPERGRRRGEEPYSRTATTPDGGIQGLHLMLQSRRHRRGLAKGSLVLGMRLGGLFAAVFQKPEPHQALGRRHHGTAFERGAQPRRRRAFSLVAFFLLPSSGTIWPTVGSRNAARRTSQFGS